MQQIKQPEQKINIDITLKDREILCNLFDSIKENKTLKNGTFYANISIKCEHYHKIQDMNKYIQNLTIENNKYEFDPIEFGF